MKSEPVNIEYIEVTERKRPNLNEDTVAQIMESVKRVGLLHPIAVRYVDGFIIDGEEVDGVPVLVAGRHRLEAMLRLGAKYIDCHIFTSEVDAQRWEISENLHRADLTVMERSEHVARWIDLTKEEQSQSSQAETIESKRADGKGHRPASGVNAAARELGLSKADAHRAVKVANLSPEAKQTARDAGLEDNQTALLEAAKETTPEKQVATLKARVEKARDRGPKVEMTTATAGETPPCVDDELAKEAAAFVVTHLGPEKARRLADCILGGARLEDIARGIGARIGEPISREEWFARMTSVHAEAKPEWWAEFVASRPPAMTALVGASVEPANSNDPVPEAEDGPPVAFLARDYKPSAPAEDFDLDNIPAHMDRRRKAA